ncbi:hypothetical protein VPBG_00010 [Vibrio phage helene 12B3]|uniref:hypothetical protein n=1 Tax=Vibrio phage helene 12B3 TaxID=573173 RepID=UPI0002C141B7|nr:hypothetical protein VPBG_00010 [Vibrio phage helene 12B3]AGG57783.1 hypothetical protein VPBG_00010 [Vibrio phage helene 12B3]
MECNNITNLSQGVSVEKSEETFDKSKEVVNLNFRGKKPHLAVTHYTQQPANGRPDALLFKSDKNTRINEELLKSLSKVSTEEELKKASFENHRTSLQEALEDRIRSTMSANGEYVWVYVTDFSEDLVVFQYQDEYFATAYSISEEGVVDLGEQEIQHVKRRNMYVDSDTGEELVKAADWLKTLSDKIDGEGSDEQSQEVDSGDPDSSEVVDEGETEGDEQSDTPVIVNEDTMTDKIKVEDLDLEDLTKSAAVQELIKAAVAEAEANKVAELEKAQLVTDTTELVKGFAGVEEDQVEVLVKALTSVDKEFGAALFKAFDGMQESLVAKDAELEEIKKSFGEKQDSIEGETTTKVSTAGTEGKQRTNDLAALVKARKAEQSK